MQQDCKPMEKIEFNGKEFRGSEDDFFLKEHWFDLITEKDHANARLFAGSKNLLKAAIEAHSKLSMLLASEAGRYTNNPDLINDHLKSNPALSQLRNAINECL